MFREAICPACREKIQVPDDREKVICMYCGKEILVSEALGKIPEEAPSDTEARKEWIFAELEEIIHRCDRPMRNFKKDSYPDVFNDYYRGCRKLFDEIDAVCGAGSDNRELIGQMVGILTETAKKELEQLHPRGKRSQRQLDYNFLISVYFIPALLKCGKAFSDPFAEQLVEGWNDAFGAMIGKGSYEDINGGFRRKLCYITTAVCENLGKGPDCYELRMLKEYRDRLLNLTLEGKALIAEYYDLAPTIVKRIEKEPDRQELYRRLYNEYLTPCVKAIEERRFADCQNKYQEMVGELKSRFMN